MKMVWILHLLKPNFNEEGFFFFLFCWKENSNKRNHILLRFASQFPVSVKLKVEF